jgi:hypothetical protein
MPQGRRRRGDGPLRALVFLPWGPAPLARQTAAAEAGFLIRVKTGNSFPKRHGTPARRVLAVGLRRRPRPRHRRRLDRHPGADPDRASFTVAISKHNARGKVDRMTYPATIDLVADEAMVMRQAFAGLLWSKQLYSYDVDRWLDGDPTQPPPPGRGDGRNARWRHFDAFDIMSMPGKWEYPWFAGWDLAFHCVALAHVDPAFAKYQPRRGWLIGGLAQAKREHRYEKPDR